MRILVRSGAEGICIPWKYPPKQKPSVSPKAGFAKYGQSLFPLPGFAHWLKTPLTSSISGGRPDRSRLRRFQQMGLFRFRWGDKPLALSFLPEQRLDRWGYLNQTWHLSFPGRSCFTPAVKPTVSSIIHRFSPRSTPFFSDHPISLSCSVFLKTGTLPRSAPAHHYLSPGSVLSTTPLNQHGLLWVSRGYKPACFPGFSF